MGGFPYTGCVVTEPPGKSVYAVNCSGKPSYNAPRYTIDLGAQQTVHLRGYNLVGNVNTQYLGNRYIGFSYQAAELAPAVWHTNAELTLAPEIGKWAVSAFIQNIENNRYATSAIENPLASSLVTTTAPPRVYGARLTVRF
jgi:iron complex outermembrane receptor protein